MRTSEVLDAIERAGQDWSISLDAMRWTPTPPPATGDRPRIQVLCADGQWRDLAAAQAGATP